MQLYLKELQTYQVTLAQLSTQTTVLTPTLIP